MFELYREVSEALECATVLHGRFSMPLLKRLAALPGVGAAKEDAGDAWCHDALWAVGDHLPILGSGPTERPVRGCQGGRSIRQSVFRIAVGHAGGYNAVQQAAMEVFGCGPRWLRQPQVSLDDGEMEELRNLFEHMDFPH